MHEGNAMIEYDGRFYKPALSMTLALEVEDELGALPALAKRLEAGNFTLAELVTFTQMALQAQGRCVDYMALGAEMLQKGLAPYRNAALCVLQGVL